MDGGNLIIESDDMQETAPAADSPLREGLPSPEIGDVGPASVLGQRRHHRRLRRRDERISQDQRTDRDQSLRRVFRQGDPWSSPAGAAIVYSIPTPDDSPAGGADAVEIALNGGVMNSVRHGGPECTVGGTIFEMWLGAL